MFRLIYKTIVRPFETRPEDGFMNKLKHVPNTIFNYIVIMFYIINFVRLKYLCTLQH